MSTVLTNESISELWGLVEDIDTKSMKKKKLAKRIKEAIVAILNRCSDLEEKVARLESEVQKLQKIVVEGEVNNG